MYRYWATITKVYDGDTITADIDLGFNMVMSDQKIRLYGINTPEVRGEERPDGLRSRDALRRRINQAGRSVELRTHRDEQGKYGRWLAEIFIDGENINQWLVRQGHAKEYLV